MPVKKKSPGSTSFVYLNEICGTLYMPHTLAGGELPDWPSFEAVNKILGEKYYANDTLTLDSLNLANKRKYDEFKEIQCQVLNISRSLTDVPRIYSVQETENLNEKLREIYQTEEIQTPKAKSPKDIYSEEFYSHAVFTFSVKTHI